MLYELKSKKQIAIDELNQMKAQLCKAQQEENIIVADLNMENGEVDEDTDLDHPVDLQQFDTIK